MERKSSLALRLLGTEGGSMSSWTRFVVGTSVALLLAASPALACSLCGSARNAQTLRQDFEQAKAVLFGTVTNKAAAGGKGGLGVTELQISRVLKTHPALGERKVVEVSRYLPVVDPRDP